MVFVVGVVVVVSVFVEVDVGDLGVVDVEVVPTLKYNTNNVANWSSNYYPWVVAKKEFNGNVRNSREKSSKDEIWNSLILGCFFIFPYFHFFKKFLSIFFIWFWEKSWQFSKETFSHFFTTFLKTFLTSKFLFENCLEVFKNCFWYRKKIEYYSWRTQLNSINTRIVNQSWIAIC